MNKHPEDERLFKELDEAINRVLRHHFDMYFDKERAKYALRRWVRRAALSAPADAGKGG